MYISSFLLKQHTPIIHFQYNDPGATLRASEVKPKLDKFLIKKLGGFENVKEKHPTWFANSEHPSLDYALAFYAVDKEIINIDNYNAPMYFGNMGNSEDKKNLILSENGVNMRIKVKDQNLMNLLNDNLQHFFYTHNFGTRQSKGYGSFTVGDDNIELLKNLFKYHFTVQHRKGGENNNYKDVMNHIGWFYKSLRSGFNMVIRGNAIYMKPTIFYYLNSQDIVWDKKTIKEAYLNHNTPENRKNYKDLMGLATTEKWRGQFDINKEDENDVVSRYKSPILFKPITKGSITTVYFDYFEPEYLKEYEGTKFNVKANGTGNLQMQIPNDFDLEDFLKFSFNLDIDEIIDGANSGFPAEIKRNLSNIYGQLKSQVNL